MSTVNWTAWLPLLNWSMTLRTSYLVHSGNENSGDNLKTSGMTTRFQSKKLSQYLQKWFKFLHIENLLLLVANLASLVELQEGLDRQWTAIFNFLALMWIGVFAESKLPSQIVPMANHEIDMTTTWFVELSLFGETRCMFDDPQTIRTGHHTCQLPCNVMWEMFGVCPQAFCIQKWSKKGQHLLWRAISHDCVIF